MEKLTNYQNILSDYLNLQAAAYGKVSDTSRTELIIDRNSNNYQLLHLGWRGNRYEFFVAFHLMIINEKIWLMWNRTELEIVDYLMERGVPKSDIVLGHKPPHAREHSGFAVA